MAYDGRVWRSRPYTGGQLVLRPTHRNLQYELSYHGRNLPYELTFGLDLSELRSLREYITTEMRYQAQRGKSTHGA